jgi:hypothetical protein
VTEVKSDRRGLYVLVDGKQARPGPVGPYNETYDMGPGALEAGQQVRAKLLPDVPLVRVRGGGDELHWCTSSTLRGDGPGSAPKVVVTGGAPVFTKGAKWLRNDGGSTVVDEVLLEENSNLEYVRMTDGGWRNRLGEYVYGGKVSDKRYNLKEPAEKPPVPQAPTAPAFHFELGQVWVNRKGGHVTITEVYNRSTDGWACKGQGAVNASKFGPAGEWRSPKDRANGPAPGDLVARISG